MDGWQGSWGTFLYAPLFPVGSIFCFLYLYDYISYPTIDVSFCLVALFLIVLICMYLQNSRLAYFFVFACLLDSSRAGGIGGRGNCI